ncbi:MULTISPECIES: SURF1 family protein [Sphingobium]|uniref:SURF1-like protein n=1 Tax=Sphingobium fuliginis (strain ATCC 27551) TaxID=336203 RepID=A0ABQ1EUK5_SPHSA|nr:MULTISPECIES: SURF1 family protein [Sphingobium]AJR25698.1 Surfeit locus 1 family protein [Sphingobium sp. YBL2]RYL99002.1 SURF1 family protein [Sphingobium fuliginis]UXC92340.1 SURF1 family protein [Sphingobium sp. RSMS]WDA37814.1 SURF1 family protein [Sphingobium sp. YC-XJ3]GFZ87325.1 SURF1-like protein [Sphingobium fuliginis]
MTTGQDGERSRRSPAFPIGLTLIALFFFAGFCALGAWQVQRLAWKRDLIARVDARIHAAPVPAPRMAAKADEYRRVRISGRFLHDKAALVQAVTVRGAGFWVLTPLVTDRGFTVIVNRGFVPPNRRRDYMRPPGEARISGLLRLSEPGGGFLRSNDPAGDRWFSRDVAAIAAARGIGRPVADYFIDADAAADPGALPVGGLTIVAFPNNHLQYAITWFALAAMVAGAYIFVMRQERKDRRG